MNVISVVLGSTFRATWVSSGAAASPIYYNLLSGSETMVQSWAGVDSGGGHYYVDAAVSTRGLWKGQWSAVVGANTYISPEWLSVYPQDTNEPGRYVDWNDIVSRFTDFADFGGAIKVASHYVAYSEAQIDSALGVKYTTPFSNNNLTIRDLTIDLAYARAIRGRSEEYKEIRADITSRIWALLNGQAVMVTTSGDVIRPPYAGGPAWSNTMDYHPVFGMLDEIDVVVSSQQLLDEYSERGLI